MTINYKKNIKKVRAIQDDLLDVETNLTQDIIKHLYLISISHKTAPVAIREKFAISEYSLSNAYQVFKLCKKIKSFVVLSTCNRTEIYLNTDDIRLALDEIVEQFSEFLKIESKLIKEYSTVLNGNDVIDHIFKLACGLDSLVLGEKQIYSQVKFAYSVAQNEKTLDHLLEKLFQSALKATKTIHSKTNISKDSPSISSAAVDLIEVFCGPLKTKNVMVLGAGLMAKLALECITKKGGAKETVVLNRSPHRVITFSEKYKIDKSFPFENIYEVLNDVDILIVAAGAPHFIVFASEFEKVRKDLSKPLYIFDISVPRNVDSEIGRLPNVKLFDIDFIQEIYSKKAKLKEEDLKEIENIILEGKKEFSKGLLKENLNYLIKEIKEKIEKVRQEKLEILKKNKEQFTYEDIDYITKNIINTFLHEPITNIKDYSKQNKDKIKMLRELFGI